MSEEKLLTVRDVAVVLVISEKDVLDLAESGKIPAYKVGGVYLRFKKEQVDEYKKTLRGQHVKVAGNIITAPLDKLRDFFYFNDFYIFAIAVIILLGFFVYRGILD